MNRDEDFSGVPAGGGAWMGAVGRKLAIGGSVLGVIVVAASIALLGIVLYLLIRAFGV